MCLPLDAYRAGAEHFIPDCAGKVDIAHARVVRVARDGALILADGRTLLLEGLRLPVMEKTAISEPVLAALRSMVLSGPVNFTELASDRYGRLRAQAFGRQWLQTALLEQGLARVQISPDSQACAPDLYDAEAQARGHRSGVWASQDYRVRAPRTLAGTGGTFQIVEGQVSQIGRAEGGTFIDLDDRRFSAMIAPADRRAFRDFDLGELPGRRIRVRGIVQTYRGRPGIALSNPYQIEVLN